MDCGSYVFNVAIQLPDMVFIYFYMALVYGNLNVMWMSSVPHNVKIDAIWMLHAWFSNPFWFNKEVLFCRELLSKMPLLKLLNLHRPGLQRLGSLPSVSRTLQLQRHNTLRLFTSSASKSLLPAVFLSPHNNHQVISRRNKNIYHKYAKYDGQKIPGWGTHVWTYFLCGVLILCTGTEL